MDCVALAGKQERRTLGLEAVENRLSSLPVFSSNGMLI